MRPYPPGGLFLSVRGVMKHGSITDESFYGPCPRVRDGEVLASISHHERGLYSMDVSDGSAFDLEQSQWGGALGYGCIPIALVRVPAEHLVDCRTEQPQYYDFNPGGDPLDHQIMKIFKQAMVDHRSGKFYISMETTTP